ncbi:MAG: response regulator transcription factor [Bacteroidales bacterium]|nr:response regulator transcription factor [Bacteroidales bacterium]
MITEKYNKMNYPNVLIVEEDSLTSEYIELVLKYYDINITGIATSSQQAMEIFSRGDTDLIICDINLHSDSSGIDFVRTAKKMRPVRVIFLSDSNDERMFKKALQLHPDSYITKPFTHSQLIASIRKIALEGEYSKNVFRQKKPTKRELEIIEQLAKGMTSRQIASILNISFETVQTHRKRLFSKFNVNSSAELIVLALRNRWTKNTYPEST